MTVTLELVGLFAAASAVTLAMKLAGYLAVRLMRPTPFLRRFLEALPGTVLVALVAPLTAERGAAGIAAVLVAAAAMYWWRRLDLAVVVAVATALALRHTGLSS